MILNISSLQKDPKQERALPWALPAITAALQLHIFRGVGGGRNDPYDNYKRKITTRILGFQISVYPPQERTAQLANAASVVLCAVAGIPAMSSQVL